MPLFAFVIKNKYLPADIIKACNHNPQYTLPHCCPGPFDITGNTITGSNSDSGVAIQWQPGKSSSGTVNAGYPSAGNILNNDISNILFGVSLTNVGPKPGGSSPPTIAIKNNRINPGVTAGADQARKLELKLNTALSPAPAADQNFVIDASPNAFRLSGAAVNAEGPSSVTVSGYAILPGSSNIKDRVQSWPWITDYTQTAATTGFTPQAGFATASGDPHFTGFDVSAGAACC